MKKQAAFRGRIKENCILYFKPQDQTEFLQSMEGKDIVVRIEEVGDDITANQRAYYFATNRYLTKEVEQFQGWEEEEVDEFARDLFLSKSIGKSLGQQEHVFQKKSSIRDLDKEKMREFIEHWVSWLSFQHGIYVPTVSEILLSKYS